MIELSKSTVRNLNLSIIISAVFLSIVSFGILYVKGTIATVCIVLYCISISVTFLRLFLQIVYPKKVGIHVGLYRDESGQQNIDIQKYEELINLYESRFSLVTFWVSCVILLLWGVVLSIAGLKVLLGVVIVLTLVSEIGGYRVYKAVKDNKGTWRIAMYVTEMNRFFKKTKED